MTGGAGVQFRRRRALLALGVAAPSFAAALLVAAVLAYPTLDHAREYVSALGGAGSTRPGLFNAAVALAGVSAMVLGVGFGLTITGLGGPRGAAGLTAALFAIAGAGMVVSSLYPWPDPRHLAIQAALLIQFAPLVMIWGLRGATGLDGFRRFLWAAFALMLLLTAVNSGWMWPAGLRGPFRLLVHEGNVGWWERGYMLVLVGWALVAAVWLKRRLARAA